MLVDCGEDYVPLCGLGPASGSAKRFKGALDLLVEKQTKMAQAGAEEVGKNDGHENGGHQDRATLGGAGEAAPGGARGSGSAQETEPAGKTAEPAGKTAEPAGQKAGPASGGVGQTAGGAPWAQMKDAQIDLVQGDLVLKALGDGNKKIQGKAVLKVITDGRVHEVAKLLEHHVGFVFTKSSAVVVHKKTDGSLAVTALKGVAAQTKVARV